MSELPLDDAGPTARALVALETIHNRPGVSGEHLARRLGVSSRAARRYVGILRAAGIPVESTPGRYGGYRVGRGFRVPPLMFSTDQALALVMAAVRGRQAVGGAVGGDSAVDEALDKIIRVLPESLAEPAEALRAVRTARNEPEGPDPLLVSALARAAQDGVRMRLGYRTRPDGETREMDVDPWGVNLRHDRWYLLCWSHTADAKRVLRLDRIVSRELLTDTFTPPVGLDVVQTVDEHLAEGWGPAVEIVVAAPVVRVARWLPRHLGRLEAIDDDHTRLVGSMDDPDWFARQLVRLEAPFRVVAPVELAEACRVLGEQFLGAVGPAQDGPASSL